jgi:hypothetical protein
MAWQPRSEALTISQALGKAGATATNGYMWISVLNVGLIISNYIGSAPPKQVPSKYLMTRSHGRMF